MATKLDHSGVYESAINELMQVRAQRDALLAAAEATLACIEADWGADLLPYNLSEPNDKQANDAVLALRAAIQQARGETR